MKRAIKKVLIHHFGYDVIKGRNKFQNRDGMMMQKKQPRKTQAPKILTIH